jgi:hypothetical protein
MQLLGSGGSLAIFQPIAGSGEISPRRKGVRQGAVLFLAGAVLVPILGVINGFTEGRNLLDILVPLAAILFFVGGLMRMLYAAIFEEGAASRPTMVPRPVAHSLPAEHAPPARGAALPPPSTSAVNNWRARPHTAEVLHQPSVTENTTRLLDKEDRKDR